MQFQSTPVSTKTYGANQAMIVTAVLDEAAKEIESQKEDVARLESVASKHPFYKYNHQWSRELQNLV